jgi:hypothetical protein
MLLALSGFLCCLLTAGIQAYFAWLCYFYVAMALRECVLLVNGSHIRSWWISHHIWSAAGSLLMLSLPISSPSECSSAQEQWL